MKKRQASVLTGLLFWFASAVVSANDVVSTKRMSIDLAAELATAAMKTCRQQGYQVSAVVVDRNGIVQVVMRDTLASRFSVEIAERKANAAVMGGIDTGSFRKNRGEIRQELNHINGLIMMQGGIPLQASGSLLGAIGVSGAPGGDKDDVCARKAIASIQERLDFAD